MVAPTVDVKSDGPAENWSSEPALNQSVPVSVSVEDAA